LNSGETSLLNGGPTSEFRFHLLIRPNTIIPKFCTTQVATDFRIYLRLLNTQGLKSIVIYLPDIFLSPIEFTNRGKYQ